MYLNLYSLCNITLRASTSITRKLQITTLHNHKCKMLLQNITKFSPTIYKKLIHYDQVWFIPRMQGWIRIWKLSSVIHHIDRRMEKTPVIISIKKKNWYISAPSYNEVFQQIKIKSIYGKHKASKFNDETLMTFPFKILAM